MNALNDFIMQHLGLSLVAGFALHHLLGIGRDFLKKDGNAKLTDSDPSNDRAGRLEVAIGEGLDRLPDPLSIIGKK